MRYNARHFRKGDLFMIKPQTDINAIKFDVAAIRKDYEKHASKCQQIAKEVNKWGKLTQPSLQFLKPRQS